MMMTKKNDMLRKQVTFGDSQVKAQREAWNEETVRRLATIPPAVLNRKARQAVIDTIKAMP